eukprot:gene21389-27712_t
MLPPNVLYPQSYVAAISEMARAYGWEITTWSPKELLQEGCGAFYSVCSSNIDADTMDSSDRLVRLIYRGTTSELDSKPVVLVGKGVCYDTGGINLKSANSMKTMKHDMAGSSVALGTLVSLTLSNYSSTVECWLPIVENNIQIGRCINDDTSDIISGSYRPDDVITAVTGDTIEIVHSDAEGRMILADTLAIASRKIIKQKFHSILQTSSPKIVIDFATLTGTCISSLTDKYIGVFTNRKRIISDIITAGEKSGERLWPFPNDDDFVDDLKSDIANILQ